MMALDRRQRWGWVRSGAGAHASGAVRPMLALCLGFAVISARPPHAGAEPRPSLVQASNVYLPRPDHVVIVIEENRAFGQIIGSTNAPYINSLAAQGAVLTDFYALTHPSQPNYIDLFSGGNQGVVDDSCPHTFGATNLASELLAAGLTFAGYGEGLPYAGDPACTTNRYVRRHCPWV